MKLIPSLIILFLLINIGCQTNKQIVEKNIDNEQITDNTKPSDNEKEKNVPQNPQNIEELLELHNVGLRDLKPPDGSMNEMESIDYLKSKGYNVEKDNDGYILSKIHVINSNNVHFKLSENTRIGWGSIIQFPNYTITTVDMTLIIKTR